MMYSLGPMDLVVPGSRKSTPGFCLVIDPINSHLKKAGLSSVALLPLATKKRPGYALLMEQTCSRYSGGY